MTTLFANPVLTRLGPARRVLIAGCGGGFDVYCGVPLALALSAAGKEVVLANLTFSLLRSAQAAETVRPGLVRVDGGSRSRLPYFPELYLARWLRDRGLPDSVYCVEREGLAALRANYLALLERERIDAVILADGGTDSLMRGDEAGLGTPNEDIASLIAMDDLPVERLLVCLGFGIDAFHGVCHAHFLENTAQLARAGGFLGTFSLVPGQAEADAYLDLVRYATALEPQHPSIVNTSIAAAVEGHFGDHHSTHRTSGSTLFINPLMAIYWVYSLQAVLDRVLYKEALASAGTWSELVEAMHRIRLVLEGQRPRRDLPV